MNQHHPDKLVAKGLPDEMIEIATQKTQDIKAAYEIIKTERVDSSTFKHTFSTERFEAE